MDHLPPAPYHSSRGAVHVVALFGLIIVVVVVLYVLGSFNRLDRGEAQIELLDRKTRDLELKLHVLDARVSAIEGRK